MPTTSVSNMGSFQSKLKRKKQKPTSNEIVEFRPSEIKNLNIRPSLAWGDYSQINNSEGLNYLHNLTKTTDGSGEFIQFTAPEYCPYCRNLVRTSQDKEEEIAQIINIFEENRGKITNGFEKPVNYATVRRSCHQPRFRYPTQGEFTVPSSTSILKCSCPQMCSTFNGADADGSFSSGIYADLMQDFDSTENNNMNSSFVAYQKSYHMDECMLFLQTQEFESPKCLKTFQKSKKKNAQDANNSLNW